MLTIEEEGGGGGFILLLISEVGTFVYECVHIHINTIYELFDTDTECVHC